MVDERTDAFVQRVMEEVNGSMSVLNLYLGHRLGLYRTMVETGPVTPNELAKHTGYNERYLREWLECMTTNGYLEHENGNGHFSLPVEYRAALTDRDDPNFIAPLLGWIPSITGILTPLLDAFRTGNGVPYDSYGALTVEAIGNGNRPMFINDYVSKWIPTMPDIQDRLKEGGRVADIGSGLGWSSISLAMGFPEVRIDGYDLDEASIEQARRNAMDAGVADRVTFHLAAAEEIEAVDRYDLVTAFEVIHDLAYPVDVLKGMRRMVKADGAVLVADEAVGDTLDENRDFIGRMNYNYSVLHCLPQAMVFPDSEATGTIMGPAKLKSYAVRGGFSDLEVLPIDNPFWRFYRLRL